MSQIFSIEGNVGSGKSTLVRYMKQKDTANTFHFIEEPVDEWENIKDKKGNNMIEKYYKQQNKYSFSFQMMVLYF